MLASKTIRIFRSVKPEPNRSDWKDKDISSGQANILTQYMILPDMFRLDRGSASLLIDCIFKLTNTDEAVSDANVLGELYKIVNSE